MYRRTTGRLFLLALACAALTGCQPRPEKVAWEFHRALLMRGGVPEENITASDGCTMCRPERYWSHRVTRGERGSQGAIIVCKEAQL